MLKAALIGTGAIAPAHVAAIRSLPEQLDLVAVVNPDMRQAHVFCQQHQITRCYADTDAMLAAEKPDLVHILTPPALHAALTIRCLEAGAWVLCEKPICASLAELDQITEAEARSGCYAASIFQNRYGGGAQHLKALIEAGRLGRSLVGIVQTTWYRDQAYYDVPWRGKWQTEIGGTSMIHGIHEIDLALWLLGDWREVRAVMATLDRQIEVDDVMMAIVTMQDGTLLSIINSALSPHQETRLRLDFQRVSVELRHLYHYSNADWHFSPAPGQPAQESEDWARIAIEQPADQSSQLREFLSYYAQAQRPPVSGQDLRRTMSFMTALYKAAITGQPVQNGSITRDDPFYHAINGLAHKTR